MRSSSFAFSSVRFCFAEMFLPPRLMKKVSIDWSAMDGAQPAASEAVWMQRDRASHRTARIFKEVNARRVSPASGIFEA